MQASLSSLAQQCAESGFDLFAEDQGPHWGRCVAALLLAEQPPDERNAPLPEGAAGEQPS